MSDKNRIFPDVLVIILFSDEKGNVVFKKMNERWVLPSWNLDGGESWLDSVEKATRGMGLKEFSSKLLGVSSGNFSNSGVVSCVFEVKGCSAQLPNDFTWISLADNHVSLTPLDAEIIANFKSKPSGVWIN